MRRVQAIRPRYDTRDNDLAWYHNPTTEVYNHWVLIFEDYESDPTIRAYSPLGGNSASFLLEDLHSALRCSDIHTVGK